MMMYLNLIIIVIQQNSPQSSHFIFASNKPLAIRSLSRIKRNEIIPVVMIPFQSRRCPSCNGYHHRKWTRRHEFKSWTRLTAFHIALIPLGKVWIQLFSLQLWVNSRTGSIGEATSLGEGNSGFKLVKLRLKIELVSYPTLAESLVTMIIHFQPSHTFFLCVDYLYIWTSYSLLYINLICVINLLIPADNLNLFNDLCMRNFVSNLRVKQT